MIVRLTQIDGKFRVDAVTGCWVWHAATAKGYGVINLNGRQTQAHRHCYELHNGPIPKSLELDHLCRNKACINPVHLEPVTHRENMARAMPYFSPGGYKLVATHCRHGHLYDDANTYIAQDGARTCRACKRDWARRKHGFQPSMASDQHRRREPR